MHHVQVVFCVIMEEKYEFDCLDENEELKGSTYDHLESIYRENCKFWRF